METVGIFYQCENAGDIEHIEVDATITFGAVKALLIEKQDLTKHDLTPEFRLFPEDGDEPTDEDALISEFVTSVGLKLHLSRCRKIKVRVHYNGQTAEREFAPGATINMVRQWVTESGFGISKVEAGELKLQLVGTKNRPSSNRHIGTFAKCPDCAVEFDLVTDEKIQG